MLSISNKKKLKQLCEEAQNPYIYYDNDADGLCSFLLLRKHLGKGEGIPIRSYPELDSSYASKALIGKADIVFVLDKPVLSAAFISCFSELHIPVVWIDHHLYDEKLEMDNLILINPAKKTSAEPVTALLYDTFKEKENLWIAMMGCLSDHYLPDFVDKFKKEYGEYWSNNVKKPFDGYYGTEIGKLARALNFGLKDSASNVQKMQEHLLRCKNPSQVLAEVAENEEFRNTYDRLKKRLDSLIEEALKLKSGDLIFFTYSGETSMSADLSNELSYKFPKKYIAVGFIKGGITNVSLRGNNVKELFNKIIAQFPGASGGGHTDAVGMRLNSQDLTRFKQALEDAIDERT